MFYFSLKFSEIYIANEISHIFHITYAYTHKDTEFAARIWLVITALATLTCLCILLRAFRMPKSRMEYWGFFMHAICSCACRWSIHLLLI